MEELAKSRLSLGIRKIYTGHCTGKAGYVILKRVMGECLQPLYPGLSLVLKQKKRRAVLPGNLQQFDHLIVNQSIGCKYRRWALRKNGIAGEIGHSAAGFLNKELTCRKIPGP